MISNPERQVYGFICRYVKIGGWEGGSEPILMLFECRNPYGKMDRPLPEIKPGLLITHTKGSLNIH